VGVFGLYLAGRKVWWAWGVGIGAQVLWFAYAVSTQQWGFIVSCLAYGWVYTKNFLAWRSEHAAAENALGDGETWDVRVPRPSARADAEEGK
jgi:hypothetical protein